MLRPKTFLIAFSCFACSFASSACGNEYYTTAEMPLGNGKLNLRFLLKPAGKTQLPYWSSGFGEDIFVRRNELADQIAAKGIRIYTADGGVSWRGLEQALERNIDYKLLSDFAWYELRVGSKRNAVRLLERLYEKYPNEYNVMANLGTAYEVTGNNERALELLKQAVAVNPASHHGSEWIHINILEQKIKARPDYSRILDLQAGKDYALWLTGKVYDKPVVPDSLMVQLAYQLHERISFIPAPDPVVGHLLLDFADLVALARSRSEAKAFYEHAIHYEPPLAAAAHERMQSNGIVLHAEKKETSGINGLYVGIAVLLAGLAAWLFIRRKRISRKPLP